MSTRVSKICLTVYGMLLALSFFLLSVPGNYWPWYAVMVPFSLVPLYFGPRRYRITGGIALLLTGFLVVGDIQGGEIHRERMQRIRAPWSQKHGERAAGDGRIALRFQIVYDCPAAPERGRCEQRMTNHKVEIVVPENILVNWQEILNIISNIASVPAALIMRLRDDDIEVFVSSQSEGNPYHLV